jgi:hypothetical protein
MSPEILEGLRAQTPYLVFVLIRKPPSHHIQIRATRMIDETSRVTTLALIINGYFSPAPLSYEGIKNGTYSIDDFFSIVIELCISRINYLPHLYQ